MNVLLLSMPDSFEHMPAVSLRVPTCALTSLAGNVDSHHRVAALDLVLVRGHVRSTIEHIISRFAPEVVGLSVMTFQRKTAQRIIELVRSLRPGVSIVVGGYDPSLAPDAYTALVGDAAIDFLVRGEGEVTFRELLRAMEQGQGYEHIAGLSYRHGDRFVHNADRPIQQLDHETLALPDRGARVLNDYRLYGKQADVIETSRGCTFDCGFCSIIEMRGRSFHMYPLERVIADIHQARRHGARAIFIVDDNVTLHVERFAALCRALIDEGLHDLDYTVQGMTSALANHGEWLAPLMRRAGFRYVFLGIENILEDDLQFLHASAKNRQRKRGNGQHSDNATIQAIDYIHRSRMYVIGGLIIGNPDDTRESIRQNLEFARKYVDWPYIQHPVPYPRTPMAKTCAEQGLIVNDRIEEYDGTVPVLHTRHIPPDEVEFLRWQAERWIKLRHMLQAGIENPELLLLPGKAPEAIAYTFRGSTLWSLLGVENERSAFERYRAIRSTERNDIG